MNVAEEKKMNVSEKKELVKTSKEKDMLKRTVMEQIM